MSLKTRVEYVYSNMDQEMVNSVAGRDLFIPSASNGDIAEWNYDDYCEHKVGGARSCLSQDEKSVIFSDYCKWNSQCTDIFDLEVNCMRWDENMVISLADYLCKHPEAFPYFIVKHSVDIIGLFMGARDFYMDSVRTICDLSLINN